MPGLGVLLAKVLELEEGRDDESSGRPDTAVGGINQPFGITVLKIIGKMMLDSFKIKAKEMSDTYQFDTLSFKKKYVVCEIPKVLLALD